MGCARATLVAAVWPAWKDRKQTKGCPPPSYDQQPRPNLWANAAPLMNLPVPNPEELNVFRALYQGRFGVDLSQEEALDACSRLVQYVYLTRHALPHLRQEVQRERGQTSPKH